MIAATNLRKFLMVGAASVALFACSDTDIATPGDTTAPAPAPAPGPTPGPTPGPSPAPVADLDLLPNGGCVAGTEAQQVTVGSTLVDVCVTSAALTSGQTTINIPANSFLVLDGPTFVGDDIITTPGGTQTTMNIGAGAVIFGTEGTDYLVVNRGSELNANGSRTAPVIFTTIEDLNTTLSSAPTNAADALGAADPNLIGAWGGLILNGSAPHNDCDAAAGSGAGAVGGDADCFAIGEVNSGIYGGDASDDDSGDLRFVQVRYAGNQEDEDNELNGIAFQGVGDGGLYEYLQVHNNSDDGIEFFGGTASARFLVLTGNDDDSLDYTDGWVGTAQFIVVEQSSENNNDQGFEFDNQSTDPAGDNDALPRSNPSVANFTIIGDGIGDVGMLLREGTAGNIFNGIVTNFGGVGLDVDQSATYEQINADALTLRSVLLDVSVPFSGDTDTASGAVTDEAGFFAKDPNNTTNPNTLVNNFFPGANELAVTALTPSAVDSRLLDQVELPDGSTPTVDYIGAFGPSEDLTNNWATGWTFALIPDVDPACPPQTSDINLVTPAGEDVCAINGTITASTTLVAGNAYRLTGPTFVGDDIVQEPMGDTGVTLTVEAGVTIYGEDGNDYLVVNRGNRIDVRGNAANPVIMTAGDDVFGTGAFGGDPTSQIGLWGGLILNGRAPHNDCDPAAGSGAGAQGGDADCFAIGEVNSGFYGGDADDDDSGNLRFMQLRYAGNQEDEDNELNGIAFQGVGNGGVYEFLQVHNNSDDGVEFFGGTANIRNVLLTGNDDDSLDYTDGWVGNAQFVLVVQDPTGNNNDQGFEFDNQSTDPAGDNDALPRSNPRVANFTIIGDNTGDIGMLLREGTAGGLLNGLVTNFGGPCLDVDQTATYDQINAGNLTLDATLFDCTTNFSSDSDGATGTITDEAGFFFAPGTNNSTSVSPLTTGATLYTSGSVGIFPSAGVISLGATDALDPAVVFADRDFFESAPFFGALEDASDTRFDGWTLDPSTLQ